MADQILRNTSSANPGADGNATSCYRLILYSENNEMHSLWLPAVAEGFFRFSDSPEHRFLGITAIDGQWVAATRKPAFFTNVSLDQSYSTPLQDGNLLQITYEDSTYSLFSELVPREHMVFHNYSVSSDTLIRIGRQANNDICYNSRYVSSFHAELSRTNGC